MKATVVLALTTSALATNWEYWTGPSCTGTLISSGTFPCGVTALPQDEPVRSIRMLYENPHGSFFHRSRDATGSPWHVDPIPGGCVDDPYQQTESIYVTC
ncbi:hypothetical protein PWT90_04500 [Aphanocladium album]|nr:hypothetical protein PWT90_04500 [Aphanocladium album]